MSHTPGGLYQLPGQALGCIEVIHHVQWKHDFHVDDALEVVEIDPLQGKLDPQVPPSLFQLLQHFLSTRKQCFFVISCVIFRVDMDKYFRNVLVTV